jgi:dipeptide transport system ATP-binding protein
MTNPLLHIEDLSVQFGSFTAVENLSLKLELGEILGIVGESGSGKSVTMLALMGLIAYPGKITAKKLEFNGKDLLSISAKERRSLIGKDMSMIFQEPMTSLNPSYTVGFQISEALKVHEGGSRRARYKRCVELLEQVGIPDPTKRLKAFPHQLSGGMCQRIMIAMAIACNPKLLIADEPTTALDVTIQAQIIELLQSLQRDQGMTLIMITHDMGVVAQCADRVNVMYAGQLVEDRAAEKLFSEPNHPYTSALLSALPERSKGKNRLPTIPGIVPGPLDRPVGCLFSPRCFAVQEQCSGNRPPLELDSDGATRCFYPLRAEVIKSTELKSEIEGVDHQHDLEKTEGWA